VLTWLLPCYLAAAAGPSPVRTVSASDQKYTATYSSKLPYSAFLEVRVNGNKHIIKARELSPSTALPGDISPGRDGLRLDEATFRAKGNRIVNVSSGEALVVNPIEGIPRYDGVQAWSFRCAGGITLKNSMLWIFTMSDVENMGEPYDSVNAFVVGQIKGAPVLLKSFSIPGLKGGFYSPESIRIGDKLLIRNSWGAIAEVSL
jgi:hypothetical protein